MKESILDVLLYLFEHYLTTDDADLVQDRNQLITGPLSDDLGRAGFTAEEIKRAFEWLDGLDKQRPADGSQPNPGPVTVGHAVRVFHGPELEKLDVQCRGFLMKLEQQGVLTPAQREVVLDRAMALDQEPLEIDDLKWVVLMVLFNQPGSEAAYAWMETQIFDDDPESVH